MFSRGVRLGYLAQNSVLDPLQTVYGEMELAFRPVLEALHRMKEIERELESDPEQPELLSLHAELSAVVDAADGYNMDVQIKKVLSGMAFPPESYQKSVSVLSRR